MTLQEYRLLVLGGTSKATHMREASPTMPRRPKKATLPLPPPPRPTSFQDKWDGDLPYPPSVNHYWRTAKGHTFISREGKSYREAVVWKLKGVKPIEGRVKVVIDVYPPDRRKRDLDNINKALLDAIKHGGVLIDDSQIKDLRLVMHDDGGILPGGKVHVALSRIADLF